MVQETIGEQLDDALAKLATKQDLVELRSELKQDMSELPFATKQDQVELRNELRGFATKQDHVELRSELHLIVKAAVQELVQVINQNTDDLCKELNRVGIPVRTRTRHTSSAE
ncbi:hypothetical protein JL100_010910 [Skermanella mucosa]|uniref:hypothetical protein n=1 Tax=Skermanella mucosa TaxID=1789672 RepID=UPI00192B47B0|nr:hypothetical protein [Skermanella mucosa]UEM23218.1 hypothetical protein JL100_010910 [Skermanella mucosa]